MVDKAVSEMENGEISEDNKNEEVENCNTFLSYDISIEEVQAAIQQLKCKKIPRSG